MRHFRRFCQEKKGGLDSVHAPMPGKRIYYTQILFRQESVWNEGTEVAVLHGISNAAFI